MTSVPFGRMLTAMVTPFTADSELDLKRAQELAGRLVEQGNDGLVISGTTGESPTTSEREKFDLLRAVKDAVGDRTHVLAGVGTYDTRHSVELARQAEKAGATGLLAVTPYYSKPPQSGLIEHFTRIADATGLPVMLYDIPGRTGVALAHETLVRLAEHPSIAAVKDAKADVAATSRLLAECDLTVYSGDDVLTLPLLSVGAVGVVSVVGHVATPQIRQVITAFLAGEVERAAQLNRRLQPAYIGMFRTQGAILSKAALSVVGFPVGGMRLPLVDATADQVATLTEDLAAAGLLPG